MWYWLFGEELPGPTAKQIQSIPKTKKESGIPSEIISAAYEPRFKLYGLGSAKGDFHFINENNNCFSYIANTPELPILKIVPITNSSSFLSISSNSLYLSHSFRIPRNKRSALTNNMFPQDKSILSENFHNMNKSYVTHWIIRPNGDIYLRSATVNYDIIDFAISSIYPRYLLFMTKTGSVRGFSIEDLQVTSLYYNYFEGLNVHTIFCPNQLTYFICHDKIDIIDLKDATRAKGPSISLCQVDSVNEKCKYLAGIDNFTQKCSLFDKEKCQQSITVNGQNTGKCAAMIKDKEWASIVLSDGFYSIYSNDKLKFHLGNGEMLVPSIFVKYEKPLLKENPQTVTFITSHGQFIELNGNSTDHFIMKTIKPKFSFIDKNDNIYVFNSNNSFSIFENYVYIGDFQYSFRKPLAVLNGYALCKDDDDYLTVVSIKKNEKVNLSSPLIPSPMKSYQIYEKFVDIVCENDMVIRFDLFTKDYFEGQRLTGPIETLDAYLVYDQNESFIQMWRPFKNTIATIRIIDTRRWFSSPHYALSLFYQSQKICGLDDDIIFFDVIDSEGKVTPEGPYIVVVSKHKINLFSFIDESLRYARQVSFSGDPITDATIASNGILIVNSKRFVKYFCLPDISQNPIFSHRSESDNMDCNKVVVPGRGFFEFRNKEFTLFLNDFRKIKFMDDRNLAPKLEARSSKILGLIPFENEIPDEKLDSIFRFKPRKRPLMSSIGDCGIHEWIQNLVTSESNQGNVERLSPDDSGNDVYRILMKK